MKTKKKTRKPKKNVFIAKTTGMQPRQKIRSQNSPKWGG
jgi:hypothetical protein